MLQGRNITVEHVPGSQNRAADSLSRLTYITRERNDNPLYLLDFSSVSQREEATLVNHVLSMHEDGLCDIDLTDTTIQ